MDNTSDTKTEKTTPEGGPPDNAGPVESSPLDKAREEKLKQVLDFGGPEDAAPEAAEEILPDPLDEEIVEPFEEAAGDDVIVSEKPEAAAAPLTGTGTIAPPTDIPDVEAEIPRRLEPSKGRQDGRGRSHRHPRDRDRERDRGRGHRQEGHPRHHSEQRREKPAKNEILVNCSPEETRVALVEDNQLIELLIDRTE
jgi:hypothetical protein